MHSYIRPREYVAVRLPSELTKLIRLVPNTTVSLGKFGSFPANQIIGRPYHLTFEILDSPDETDGHVLRVVPAAELHAEALLAEGSGDADGEDEEIDMNEDDSGMPMRTNREIIDDKSTQKLTLEEIEALKKEASGAGREIIAKLLESHSALDQKTAFSRAKYTLRKRKKFLKRFTVLPLDVSTLARFMLEEKDAPRVMELRDELIGLIGCWGNVHHGGNPSVDETLGSRPNARYLVVDETGGLIVAAMAERMGILYPEDGETGSGGQGTADLQADAGEKAADRPPEDANSTAGRPHPRVAPMSATSTTITLLHAHSQPNLSLLKYFGFELDSPNQSHPLHAHLKTVSWLQLIDPESDPIYATEPHPYDEATLSTLKPSKRSAHNRKRARWQRVRTVVDETRAGGFDGLIVATLMEPASVLKHTVPLLAGSASVVVYSPTPESLIELVDLYSTPRRTAYINGKREIEDRRQQQRQTQPETDPSGNATGPRDFSELEEEFIIDPTLLLAPSLQTSRVRSWQVLPGRTHPLMSSRGGAEGYVFHAIRVLPSQQHIQAFGNPSRKKRKVALRDTPTATTVTTPSGDSGMDVDVRT